MKTNEKVKQFYNNLQKKRKRIKRSSILFALFVLSVNIYGWFVYVSQAGVDLEGSVKSWDVGFFDGDESVQNILMQEMLYPGMADVSKELMIKNTGESNALLSYTLSKCNILGNDALLENTSDELVTSLENDFPFVIKLSSTKSLLGPNENSDFNVSINWIMDDASKYFKLNKYYKFDPTVTYYNFIDDRYVENTGITADNFDAFRDNLYLEKDDADSFFGEACGEYQEATGKPCVDLSVKLKVEQVN